MPAEPGIDLARLRRSIVGIDSSFETPFGPRLLVYCDYTASGRSLQFLEDHLLGLQRHYANTHTEDDVTGRNMTHLLHAARDRIRESVHAGPEHCVLACGTGATGAIHHLQQILGIAATPALRDRLRGWLGDYFGLRELANFQSYIQRQRPVVFVGPYEHHSNEISWREGICEVVEIGLDPSGGLDLEELEQRLREPRYDQRRKIGSFSAASNVTGRMTPVHDVARLLHRYGALACFDYAASAPYVPIDMDPHPGAQGGDPSLDAIFLSPHKFLGGPGSSGLLVFKRSLYPHGLGPTVAGGGTVDYVSETGHDFVGDIEEREGAGTPGVLQLLKASLALELKGRIGEETILAREHAMLARALDRWRQCPNLELLGDRHLAIVSFNIGDGHGRFLHPKFVTRLLNDLFGIQSRAGCSCAGPYGHRLLGIDSQRSAAYRRRILEGQCGIKPGWVRIGFHYVMDDAEVDYILDAVAFVAGSGARFLPLYDFDLRTGSWTHREEPALEDDGSLDAALVAQRRADAALPVEARSHLYADALAQAARIADSLPTEFVHQTLSDDLAPLQFFPVSRTRIGRRPGA